MTVSFQDIKPDLNQDNKLYPWLSTRPVHTQVIFSLHPQISMTDINHSSWCSCPQSPYWNGGCGMITPSMNSFLESLSLWDFCLLTLTWLLRTLQPNGPHQPYVAWAERKGSGSLISYSLECPWDMLDVPWFRAQGSCWRLLTAALFLCLQNTFFPLSGFLVHFPRHTDICLYALEDGLFIENWEFYDELPHLHTWVSLRTSFQSRCFPPAISQMWKEQNFIWWHLFGI